MASNAMTWPRERRSGSIETKPGAAPGKHLHGGEPGAHGAASSAPARPASRPGPRAGRPRARLFRLLPVLALLLGALGLFAPAPAEAQRAAPTVSATAGDASVRVDWTFTLTPNPGDWEIQYGVHPSGSTSTVTVVASTARSRTISGLTNARTYRFRVRGITSNVTQWSDWVTATPQPATPGAPTGLTVTPGVAQLSVSWTAPSGTVTGYDVHYTSSTTVAADATVQIVSAAAGWLAVSRSGTTASQTISTLMNGTPYRVRVRAKNTAGNSAWVVKSGTPSATATGTVWSATLTAGGTSASAGCNSLAVCNSALTSNSFRVGGQDYSFRTIAYQSSGIVVSLSANKNTALQALKFCVGSTGLDFPDTTGNIVQWSSPGVSWSVGDTVSLSIGRFCPQVTRSTNANLSGLTAGSSTSSTGTFTNFSIGTFGAATTTYTASVANAQTHVKLTPTVDDTGKATVAVRKGQGSFTTVTSGSASGAIALDVGANTLVVRVTAEDGTTTKDYTVTITRRAAQTLSTNADLSALTVGSSTSSTGTFTNFSIGTFGATTTTYTASVANDRTHVKLTPTVADTGATVTVAGNAVTSGTASGPIALSVGSNAITVRVTAEDTTTTKDYTVTVTRAAAVQATATTAVSATMTVGDGGSWKGFRASSNTGALSKTDFTSAGVSYRILSLRLTNSGWLGMRLDKALDHDSGLVLDVGGTRFRLVDAVLSTGPGHEGVTAGWFYSNQGDTPPSWSVGDTVAVSLGTATSSTVKLAVRPNPVREGSWVSVEACLSAAPQGRTRIPVTLSHGTSANPSETGDWGVSQSGRTDGSLPIFTAYSIVINDWFQSRCGSVNIPTHRDSDHDDDTFTVALDTARLPPGVQAGSPASVEVRIQDLQDWPEVTLRAVRDAVAEGSPVELQAVLTKPLATDVAIPLRLRGVTAERPDYGSITSITIAAGSTTGSGTIDTSRDDDTDDERFAVAVVIANLPSGVAPGTFSEVGIRIVDGANARLRALDLSGN